MPKPKADRPKPSSQPFTPARCRVTIDKDGVVLAARAGGEATGELIDVTPAGQVIVELGKGAKKRPSRQGGDRERKVE